MTKEELEAGWKWRALKHTGCNKTEVGALLLACLKIKPNSGSWFNRSGFIIASDGFVMGEIKHHDGRKDSMVVLGTVKQYTDKFRRLADDIKLNDADRADMFRYVRESIQKDLRVVKDYDLWK